ncbi:hypothetical protein NEUTE2DRAFT_124914 [Neurospora tetrasperma FGSC 2509]|nr:hypothetical protein NEUTE2DRAFT_124914 [Neurospora tetrasperma FGSC 2509]
MTWTRHMASVKLAVLAGLARNGKWSEKCVFSKKAWKEFPDLAEEALKEGQNVDEKVEGGSGLVFEHIETGRTRNWIDRNCPCST